jgi:hypothetical protein
VLTIGYLFHVKLVIFPSLQEDLKKSGKEIESLRNELNQLKAESYIQLSQENQGKYFLVLDGVVYNGEPYSYSDTIKKQLLDRVLLLEGKVVMSNYGQEENPIGIYIETMTIENEFLVLE